MNIFGIITSLIVTAVMVGNVISLQCYDCSSDALPGCSDPFSSNTIPVVNCEGDSGSACFKLVTTTSSNVKKTFRGCSAMGTCNTQSCFGFNSYSSLTNFCTTDKCNNTSQLTGKFKIIAASIIFLLILGSK